jgi:hypothetical protein
LLLAAGADPNAITESQDPRHVGQTMLQRLLSSPNRAGVSKIELCAALLAAGADPTLTLNGPTPLVALSDGNAWGDKIIMREMMFDVVARRELVADLEAISRDPSSKAAPSTARL